jgi:hypothetical protein
MVMSDKKEIKVEDVTIDLRDYPEVYKDVQASAAADRLRSELYLREITESNRLRNEFHKVFVITNIVSIITTGAFFIVLLFNLWK